MTQIFWNKLKSMITKLPKSLLLLTRRRRKREKRRLLRKRKLKERRKRRKRRCRKRNKQSWNLKRPKNRGFLISRIARKELWQPRGDCLEGNISTFDLIYILGHLLHIACHHFSGGTVLKQLCFLCGLDITGKTPFEYGDNKFCSIKCVKMHRTRNP